MVPPVSFLPGYNPDVQGTENLPRRDVVQKLTAITERNNY